MQLKVKRKNLLTDALYVLFVLCYLMVLLIWGMGSSFSQIRYYILMFATVVAGLSLIRRRKTIIYGKNLLLVIPLGLLFLAISLQRANEAQHVLLFRTYVQISLIVLPALYAMFLLNLLKIESLMKLMEITLICTVIAYFIGWEFLLSIQEVSQKVIYVRKRFLICSCFLIFIEMRVGKE